MTENRERDWLGLAREVLDVEAQGLAAVRDGLGPSFPAALAALAACRGRVAVAGIGKSGLVGRKIAATLSSTGTPAFFLHPVEGAHGDLGMVRSGDVVLAISNSGETDELNALLPALTSLGAVVVALTGDPDSTLGRLADHVISSRVPREACPLGLAPTASTTAALALGDALAVCLMEWKQFDSSDFRRMHPGGSLGRRLCLTVRELMHAENLPVVPPDAPWSQALDVLNRGGLGLAAVAASDRRLVGVVSDGDVRRTLCRGLHDPSRPVSGLMTQNPSTVAPDQSAAEVLDLMESRQITVLPVVDPQSRLLGLVHLHDVLGKGRVKFAQSPFEDPAP